MMGKNLTTDWERTQQQIEDYLACRMDEGEQEAFERRIFAEPGLSVGVERAAELKAAFRETAAGSSGIRWMPLAAAAAVMAFAVGIWVSVPLTEVGDTPRGDSTELTLEIAEDNEDLSVSWREVPDAANYQLRVHLEDGSILYEQLLPGDSTIHRFSLDAGAPGRKLLRVRALDSFRQVRADSGLVPLPGD